MELEKLLQARITRPLDLALFDPAYEGVALDVWVTPSRAHLQEWMDITQMITGAARAAEAGQLTEEESAVKFAEWKERQLAWYARTWDISLAEARELHDACQERNPLLWDWITLETSRIIGNYRQEKLKN